MEDHLRFSVAYWHSFAWPGTDPFGGPTFQRPWFGDDMEAARLKADVAFEMFDILGVPFFAFHDRDIAPEGASLAESNRNVRDIAEVFAAQDAEVEDAPPLGHGEPLLQPPLHGAARRPTRTPRCSPTPRRR